MQLPPNLKVTEQSIDISNLNEQQINYYNELANKLADRYKDAGRGRQIFILSGPGGSGKSVTATILEYIFKEEDSLFQFMNVSLDAFHLSNEVLSERNLLDVKGRYDTYDTSLLYEKLYDFKNGESVLFPIYSRADHHPIPDRLPTANENILLLLEGGWLLRNTPDWERIRTLSTYNYGISGSNEEMREGIIRRHIHGGRTTEDAINFYTSSDLPNTEEILKNSIGPDEQVLYYRDIK